MTEDLDQKRADLLARLQTALELELATIPPYLVALLSIRLPGNRQAAEHIRGVAIEEMLHVALIGNVINAVGGTVRIDRDACPVFPLILTFEGKTFADRRFPLSLARFSADTIKTFMEIEKPAALAGAPLALDAEIDVPAPTIGDFYTHILDLMDEMEAAAPGTLFTGDPARQLPPDFYWGAGGAIVKVTDMTSARAAIEQVIAQGEAAWPPSQEAFDQAIQRPYGIGHFYRFAEIHHGRYFTTSDDPAGAPSGPPFIVDYTQVENILPDAKQTSYPAGSLAADLNLRFNTRYTQMLRQLEEALTGSPDTLYTAIMNGMHGMTSVARKLMATPLEGDAEQCTGCPSFEWID